MKQSVYVDLDSLLDTRIATISSISQEAAVLLVKDSRYYERLIDDFEPMCGISRERFDEAYAERDRGTLQRSVLTNIIVALRKLIDGLVKSELTDPTVDGVEVVVNFWPYRLSGSETRDIVRSTMYYMGMRPTVRSIYVAPKDLTPQYIKSTFSGLIMYDYPLWFKLNCDALVHCRMPDVTLMAPALFKDRIPTDEEAEVNTLKGMNPFEVTEFATLQCIGLTMIESGYFTLIRPNPPKPT
jgi:hypothetical protein